ncbi:MAG: phosphate ABC transporter permease PstA [Bacilli bacterium]
MFKFTRRYLFDVLLQGITFLFSSISFLTLGAILVFVFNQGWSLINIDLIRYPYESTTILGAPLDDQTEFCFCEPNIALDEGVFYSNKWGVGFEEGVDLLGQATVQLAYIHPDSPLASLKNKGIEGNEFVLLPEYLIQKISYNDRSTSLARRGVERMVNELESSNSIFEIEVITKGGGIGGSIITTLWLIALTLLIAIPVGVGAALYLNEYAQKSQVANGLRSFIETLTGVPSIIFGLLGVAIFIPLTVATTNATGGNLISGALTLSVILLPIIIRTTEESLKVVPVDYRNASLALGASRTQTTFKVVVPNALPGILAAVLLGIGRIVGESAALIFAIGSIVRDEITLTDKSTSLAVHIYSMMTDEPANIELSSTIAIIILAIVLILNLIIKFISNKVLKGKLGGVV